MDPGSDFRIDFVRTTILGDPTCIEHAALQWVAAKDLLSLELAPSDRRFAEFLQSFAELIFEFFGRKIELMFPP